MRITNAMMVNQFLNGMYESLNRVNKYQNQVNTTKRITNISEDPQATVTALRARNKLSGLKIYQDNINTAKSYLKEAEAAAKNINSILQTTYEKVIEATGIGKNEEDLSIIADELKTLQQELVSIGNTTIGTTYLFGGFNFTGTKDNTGAVKPPFNVDPATGHLIYNNIDLTQIACFDDYNANADSMAKFADDIKQCIIEIADVSSHEYARDTICAKALNAVRGIIYSANAALKGTERFGLDTGASDGYKKLYDFVSSLSELSDQLSDEISLRLAGDYILDTDPSIKRTETGEIDYEYYKERHISVLTEGELNNRFNLDDAKAILASIGELLDNSDATVGLDYSMYDAVNELRGEMESILTATNALTNLDIEADNKCAIQIGKNNSVDFMFTGLDLLGSGKDNLYYILDKCISMLKSNDVSGLSKYISEIQDAQSSILSFQTVIGASINRMDLITTRYDSSDYNYLEMLSNAIDADMAQSIMQLTTALTVYNSALAAGAEIVQTSLLDFLN